MESFIEIYALDAEGNILSISLTGKNWNANEIEAIYPKAPLFAKGNPNIKKIELRCTRKAASYLPALSYEALRDHLETVPEDQRKELRQALVDWPDPISASI